MHHCSPPLGRVIVALAAAALAAAGCGPSSPSPAPDAASPDVVADSARPDGSLHDAGADATGLDATVDAALDVPVSPDVVADAASDAASDGEPRDVVPASDAPLVDSGYGLCPASYAEGLGRPCDHERALCDPIRWCAIDAGSCDLLRCLGGTWQAYHVTMIDPTTDVFLCAGLPCDPRTHYCRQMGGHLPIVPDSSATAFSQVCEPLPDSCAGTPSCACVAPTACSDGLMAYCLDPVPWSPGVSVNCAP